MAEIKVQEIEHDYKEAHPAVGWVAAVAAIGLAVAVILLTAGGTFGAEVVLWLDAAMIASAVIGLLAWIVASIVGY